jgi:type IV pilus assembly protein PilC
LPLPWFGSRIKPAALAVFTRQLATLVEAGMPLLRGLRLLQEQERRGLLRRVTGELALAIEGGSSFGEAIAAHPRIFDQLFASMVKAGEISGSLEQTLRRLADFMEKARKLKGKVKAAMYYPCAVLVVASGILLLLMTFVVPRFRAVFEGLTNGASMPAFTRFVFSLSESIRHRAAVAMLAGTALVLLFLGCLKTKQGRKAFDRLKLALPVVGALFRKAAISRFARTLGTLIGSGVPILQALTIVKETAGNVTIGEVIADVHENVKQGEPIADTLKHSGVFPAMIAGMVDVGEQTGALPEMLAKIADGCDEDVDNAAAAMTSLLEPILIVVLAVIVGSIVIAIFLPLVRIDVTPTGNTGEQ